MMARWSNDRYTSTPHRVVSPETEDRYSIAFFAEPNPNTVIDCLPDCYDEINPPKYNQTTCLDYMLWRFSETY
jgi:isopenicillin N synthase-like dioxygenase